MKTEFAPQLLADPDTAVSAAEIRRCVRCGFCNATCPTQVLLGDERDSPRGRIWLIKDMLETQRVPTAETVTHIDRCLSCLACVSTCPSGVNYTRLIDQARSYIEQRYRRPWAERTFRRLLGWVLSDAGRMRTAMMLGRLARPFRSLFGKTPVAALLALTPAKAAPNPRWAQVYPSATPPRARVAILQGCAEPALQPQIRAATIRLLNRMGLEVVLVKGEGCCGSLQHHMGDEEHALAKARANVAVWTGAGVDAIVTPTSGCGATLKNYGHMLREDAAYAAGAAEVSAKAADISEIIERYGLPPLVATSARPTVAYHAACSLQHGQQIKDLPARLLEQAGFVVRRPAEGHLCCGSAGTYNILQPEIAGQLRTRKLENLERLSTDVIASGNIGCIVQLADKTPVVHTVQLLDWATGGPNPLAS